MNSVPLCNHRHTSCFDLNAFKCGVYNPELFPVSMLKI